MSALEGRVIAIAGAGGGLGPGVAARLASERAIVAGTDRDQTRLDAVASDLGLAADRWDGHAVDLLDEEAAQPRWGAISQSVGGRRPRCAQAPRAASGAAASGAAGAARCRGPNPPPTVHPRPGRPTPNPA